MRLKRYIFFFCFLLAAVLLKSRNLTAGDMIMEHFLSFFKEMIRILPFMFVIIGLFDVWFPKEAVQRHVGEDSGVKGTLLVIALAMLQMGPLYGAFPVAYLLWKKGCRIMNIFVYLGAFSTAKISLLSFEIGFLGLKFSFLRTAVTLPVFILIAKLMELYLRNRNFVIKENNEET